MSHSVVTIRLNGNPYQIGCGAGEEAHVSKLGEEVEFPLAIAGRVGWADWRGPIIGDGCAYSGRSGCWPDSNTSKDSKMATTAQIKTPQPKR